MDMVKRKGGINQTNLVYARVTELIKKEGIVKVLELLKEEIIKLENEPSKQINKAGPYENIFITRKQLEMIYCPSTILKMNMIDKNSVALSKNKVYVNVKNRQFQIADKIFSLAPRRFDMFCTLLCSDEPVNRDNLLKRIWGSNYFEPKIVDITVARLRNDLRTVQKLISIKTVRHGYNLEISDYIL